MRKWNWLNTCYKGFKNNPWLVLLFLVGAVIRILYIGSIPPGLNQDEASIGYDAYAILHYGIDRNGVHLPIHLIAWGSGQNALYAYLSMPFILLFGLTPMSVRMVSLFTGLLGMIIFYLVAKHLFKSSAAGIAAMFFISINPWHIMMSRWALESNLFPTLILIAVYCVMKSFQSPKWSYGFTIILALSLYAYGTAYFFVPLFIFTVAVLLLFKKVLKLRTILWNGGLFILLALPIFMFVMLNRLKLQEISTPFFTIPRLTNPRVDQISTIFSGNIIEAATNNFRKFISIFLSGNDGLPWNSISSFGYAYPIAVPFVLLGLVILLKSSLHLQDQTQMKQVIVIIWLFIAVLLTFITDVNINRINVIFYPLILLIVSGLMWLFRKEKVVGVISVIVFGIFFVMFTTVYFRDYPKQIGPAFFESIGEAIQYASTESDGKIYVTNRVNMPYIYVLFYERINPKDFINTVNYTNPGGAFQQVSSFGRYVFGNPDLVPGEQASYIYWNGDPIPMEEEGMSIKRFANYTVVTVQ
ncbi:phospholipid carrier-dependent glycosyltransferase [Paenibacillus segetis]|nr:glycosyltransferase family 39 protein [Paenibacillus segetis]